MNKEEIIKKIKNITQYKEWYKTHCGEDIDYEDILALEEVLDLIDRLQKENEKLRNRIDRALKKLDTGDYVAYTFYGDLLYEDIELIEILKGEKE